MHNSGSLALLVCSALLITGCSDDPATNDALVDYFFEVDDPIGDQVCADSPGASNPPFDITKFQVQASGQTLTATMNVDGDMAAHNAALDAYEGLPLSLQLFFPNNGYLEAFFDDRDHMKVADSKATASYTLASDELEITLNDLKAPLSLADVETFTFSTFVYSYPNYDGSCDDSVTIDR